MDVPANHIRSPEGANHVEEKSPLYSMYLCCPSHHIKIIRHQSSHSAIVSLTPYNGTAQHWIFNVDEICHVDHFAFDSYLFGDARSSQSLCRFLGIPVGQPFRLSAMFLAGFKPLARGLGVQHDNHTQAAAYRRKRRDYREYRRLTRMPAGKERGGSRSTMYYSINIYVVLPSAIEFYLFLYIYWYLHSVTASVFLSSLLIISLSMSSSSFSSSRICVDGATVFVRHLFQHIIISVGYLVLWFMDLRWSQCKQTQKSQSPHHSIDLAPHPNRWFVRECSQKWSM